MDYLDLIDNMSLEELFDFLDYRKGHKVDYAEQEFRYELAREEEQLKYLEEKEKKIMEKEISFEDLKKANDTIKTTDVKGKAYAEVNQRIKAFRMVYPIGTIDTEMISNENGVCIFKATVGNGETILGVGHAYEKENSTFINKTSYIENCETSAVGRALGMVGFGIDTSVASAEEVQNAIIQQDDDKVIDKTKAQALDKSIENAGITDEVVELILSGYGYTSTSEIKMKDYQQIIQDFKSKKE